MLTVKFDESIKLDGTMPQTPEASKIQGSLGYEATLPYNRYKRDLQSSKRQNRDIYEGRGFMNYRKSKKGQQKRRHDVFHKINC